MSEQVKDPLIFETSYRKDTAAHLDEEIEKRYPGKYHEQELLTDYPTVYIIDNQGKQSDYKEDYTVYVGETIDIQRRTLEHLDADPETRADWEELRNAKNAHMFVIGHEHFNKSLALDIENRMMQYLSSVDVISELNNRRENAQRKYYTSEEFIPIFNRIWDKLGENKQYRNLFPPRQLLEKSAIFKASPFNKLTDEQNQAKKKILKTVEQALAKNQTGQLVLVTGEAGAGKTVLMSNIFYELAKQDQLNAVMMVNHPQQVKVYRQIVKKLGVGDDETVVKPTHFINKYDENHKVDVAFIDEAHLLWTKQNQGYHGHGDNQLLDILQRAKVVLAVYDHKQVLTADEIMENEDWQQIKRLAGDKVIRLKNQMRIAASDETIRWIRDFIDQRRVFPIPQDDKYDLQVFDDPKVMQEAIAQFNAEDHGHGISRMVATFDWEYSSNRKPKDGSDYWCVSEGDWSMPWNLQLKSSRKQQNGVNYDELSWAEQPHTIKEIGSTYTVQGFDLNHVGVVIGPSVKYRDGKVVFDPSASANKKAVQRRTMKDNSKQRFGEQLLHNELNVLLTRGVHGLYLHAVDPQLQAALKRAALDQRHN